MTWHAYPNQKDQIRCHQIVHKTEPAAGSRRAAATPASPVLRSDARMATSERTPKYLPLPQPTSAMMSPQAKVSRKARTLGHTANLQSVETNKSLCKAWRHKERTWRHCRNPVVESSMHLERGMCKELVSHAARPVAAMLPPLPP